ncbi:MAG TPA: twin-arginine translocase subunit TatC, partial [Kineosporiaceae bacterium]|nr:twin-arginine translocase subunit TatC [Kineosporiaceae bacterium]
MAVTTPRRRSKDPEGRMPLREHLRELRNRLVKSGIAVLVGGVVGWFLYDPLLSALIAPITTHRVGGGITGINFSGPVDPFNIKLRISTVTGLVIASPVWLYQLWAFIVPGLTRREKRYAIGYVSAAVPLFLAGVGLSWLVLPNAVHFFFNLTPVNGSNLIDANTYLTFVTQIILAFGVAFVIPLLLVALNMIGMVSALALAKGWRIAVFLTFLFAAIASPTPDAGSMLALAFPMVALYMAAVGVCWM